MGDAFNELLSLTEVAAPAMEDLTECTVVVDAFIDIGSPVEEFPASRVTERIGGSATVPP